MDQRSMYSSASQPSVLQTNKVLRNTYMLLAMTLAFSAVCAGIAMAVGISPMMSLVMTIGAFITLFVVQKKADSASGNGPVNPNEMETRQADQSGACNTTALH